MKMYGMKYHVLKLICAVRGRQDWCHTQNFVRGIFTCSDRVPGDQPTGWSLPFRLGSSSPVSQLLLGHHVLIPTSVTTYAFPWPGVTCFLQTFHGVSKTLLLCPHRSGVVGGIPSGARVDTAPPCHVQALCFGCS